jgi:hypothetical protein
MRRVSKSSQALVMGGLKLFVRIDNATLNGKYGFQPK